MEREIAGIIIGGISLLLIFIPVEIAVYKLWKNAVHDAINWDGKDRD